MGGGKKRWRCCENRLTIAMAVGLSTKPSESDNQGCFADGNTRRSLCWWQLWAWHSHQCNCGLATAAE